VPHETIHKSLLIQTRGDPKKALRSGLHPEKSIRSEKTQLLNSRNLGEYLPKESDLQDPENLGSHNPATKR